MKRTDLTTRGLRGRLRDFLAYIAIGVALVSLLIVGELKFPSSFDWKWIAFGLNTAMLCGFVLHWFRSEWHHSKFWLILFLALVLHSAGFMFAFRAVSEIPSGWYAVLIPLELQFIVSVSVVSEFIPHI